MKHIILIILLTLGVWAQEVGVPYVDTREAVAQSAALSPDGETFYTYANNTLTHWSLNPVKVLDSVKIEDMDIVNGSWHRIYVTPDLKKIIFVTKKSLVLFDLTQKKVIKKKSMLQPIAGLIGKDLFVVSKMALYKLNPNTLETSLFVESLRGNFDYDTAYFILYSDDQETFVVVSAYQFIVIKGNTLEIIKRFTSANDTKCNISMSSRFIEGELTFDVKQKVVSSNIYNDKHECRLGASISLFKNLVLTNGKRVNTISFFEYGSSYLLGSLYQFRENSWVLTTSNGYFDYSPESRKYLYMKTQLGESVPIDDTTYNKFHKKINLKD